MYLDNDILYVKYGGSRGRSSVVHAYSAAGTGNKMSVTSNEIDVGTSYDYGTMFSDDDYFYFGAIVNSILSFHAYSKTTRLRDANGDFTVPSVTVSFNKIVVSVFDTFVYFPLYNQSDVALVKAV